MACNIATKPVTRGYWFHDSTYLVKLGYLLTTQVLQVNVEKILLGVGNWPYFMDNDGMGTHDPTYTSTTSQKLVMTSLGFSSLTKAKSP